MYDVIFMFVGILVAGSLEELQNQTTRSEMYRIELETYLLEHNMSRSEDFDVGPPSEIIISNKWIPLQDELIEAQETSLLESIVKEHMELCKRPHDIDSENIIRNNGGGDSSERGIALHNAFLKGDCNTISKSQVEEQQIYLEKMKAENAVRSEQDLLDKCKELRVKSTSASIGAVCDEVLSSISAGIDINNTIRQEQSEKKAILAWTKKQLGTADPITGMSDEEAKIFGDCMDKAAAANFTGRIIEPTGRKPLPEDQYKAFIGCADNVNALMKDRLGTSN